MQSQLDGLFFENKKGIIQDFTFIHSDSWHVKADKPRENEAKKRRNMEGTLEKRVLNQTLDINLIV